MTHPADLLPPLAEAAEKAGYEVVQMECFTTGRVTFRLKRVKSQVASLEGGKSCDDIFGEQSD